MPKPAFRKDAGGTLDYDTPHAGAVTAQAVELFDELGASAGSAVATAVGNRLSCAVSAAVADAFGRNYRAQWTYTQGGVEYVENQTFAVVKAVLYCPLTSQRFVQEFAPLLAGRISSGQTDHSKAIATAWDELLDTIAARGNDPHRIIDPRQLAQPLAYLTAAIVASGFAPGNQSVQEWQMWAESRRADAMRLLDQVLAAIDWYDEDDDLAPDGDEEMVNHRLVRLVR